VISLVGVEGGDLRGVVGCIVICEFCEGEQLGPVGLLVVAVHVQILLQCLIDTLGLSVSFWVITGRKAQLHVKSHAKRAGEMGDEFRAVVTSNMTRNAVDEPTPALAPEYV
jgi:hypothetical protein